MLPQLHGLSEQLVVGHVSHGLGLLLPGVLELQLHSLDWQEEPKELVVLLDDVLPEHQVERPLDLVV